jgi:hypothetical protein
MVEETATVEAVDQSARMVTLKGPKGAFEKGNIGALTRRVPTGRVVRARVTQVMGLLRLAPEIRQSILAIPATACRPEISERGVNPIHIIRDVR